VCGLMQRGTGQGAWRDGGVARWRRGRMAARRRKHGSGVSLSGLVGLDEVRPDRWMGVRCVRTRP